MISCAVMNAPDPSGPRFSSHGRLRMCELGANESLVREALEHPLAEYPGDPRHHNSARIYVGRRIRVVFDPATNTVITVQLRTVIPYVHGQHTLANLPQQRSSN